MQEILSKRTYRNKVFDNEDGTFTLRAGAGHEHYKDENGDLVEVDISFVDNGDHWLMNKASYHLKVFKDFSAPTLIEYTNKYEGADHTITYDPKLLGWVNATDLSDYQVFRQAQAVQGTLTENNTVVKYTDAFGPGLDFEITLLNKGFKKELVINALNNLENPPTANHKLAALFQFGGTGLKVLKDQVEWDKDSYLEGEGSFQVEEAEGRGSIIKPALIKEVQKWEGNDVAKVQAIKVFWKKHNNKLYQAKVLPKQFLLNATYPVRADTTTDFDYNDIDIDGNVYNNPGDSTPWSTVRSAASGTNVDTTGAGQNSYARDSLAAINRSYIEFDTSAIGSGNTVTAVDLILETCYQNGVGGDAGFQAYTPDTPGSLGLGDYNSMTLNSPTEFTDSRATPANACGTYAEQTITFNSNGIANVDVTGDTYICFRETHDIDDTATSGSLYAFWWKSEDTATASERPVLRVTYEAAGGAPVSTLTTLNAG